MGVPYETFWHLTPYKLKSFTKAHKLKAELEDYNDWRQGAYIYEAIACLIPVMHPFAKKGTKAKPYPDKPFTKRAADNDPNSEYMKAQSEAVLFQLQMMQTEFERTHPKAKETTE